MSASNDHFLKKQSAEDGALPDFWWINSQLCLEHHPYLPVCSNSLARKGKARSIISRAGMPTLEYRDGNNRKRFFHSWYDPIKEAKQLADSVPLNKDSILVVLGGGLFYHVKALLERIPDSWPVVVIERDEDIFHAAMQTVDLAPLFCRKDLTLSVGAGVDEAIKAIQESGKSASMQPVLFFRHPPSMQTFADYYTTVMEAFQQTSHVTPRDRLRYKKFAHDEVSALLLTTSYFLMGDVVHAMKQLGIRNRLVTLENGEQDCGTYLRSLARHIEEMKPDVVFTINHLGLDREGMVAQFLNDIGMPYISWYVDNPDLIIPYYKKSLSPYCGLFLWDRRSVSEMKALGYDHVFYTPLGVDERRFRPLSGKGNPFAGLQGKVGFVGNSMVHKTAARLQKIKGAPQLECFLEVIAEGFSKSDARSVAESVKLLDPEINEVYCSLPDHDRAVFDTAIMWEATKQYRLERVRHILPFDPVIAGDSGWFDLIEKNRFQYLKEISYYDELPYFYNMMKINFNATSRQMKGAVNQRVFDVPACNQFLLTDYEEQLEDLFEVGTEVVCYRQVEEIEELVRYYGKHDEQRKAIARKGYQRVIRDHTYVKRIDEMMNRMKTIFKG